MNLAIFPWFKAKICRAGPHVTLLIPIGLNAPVDTAQENIVSDVKFSLAVEKGIFYVLLKDKGPKFSITIALSSLQSHYYVIKTVTDSDTVSLISVLSRFDYPYISNSFIAFLRLLNTLIALQKLMILWVLGALANMKGHWHRLEGIFCFELLVTLEIVVKSLLVADVKILL